MDLRRSGTLTYIDSRHGLVLEKELTAVFRSCGPVAQLGARMTGSHEVEGSNPSRSTNSIP